MNLGLSWSKYLHVHCEEVHVPVCRTRPNTGSSEFPHLRNNFSQSWDVRGHCAESPRQVITKLPSSSFQALPGEAGVFCLL
jgi:hypothetical protein